MRPLLRGLALSLGTLSVLLGAAELYLRARYPAEIAFYSYDDHLITKLVPGGREVHKLSLQDGGGWVVSTINSRGYRGPEWREHPQQGRILVAGDSFVQAYFSEEQDTFVARLAEEIRRGSGRDVEVLNTGVAGYGPDQSLLVLRDELERAEPDMLILALCCENDFGDLARNKIFELTPEGELALRAYEVPKKWFERLARNEARRAEERGQFALLRAMRALRPEKVEQVEKDEPADAQATDGAGSEMEQWLRQRRKEFKEYQRPDGPIVYGGTDTYDADISLTPGSESARAKQLLMLRILEELRDRCARRSIPFVIMPIPSSVDLCDRFQRNIDRETFDKYRPDAISSAYVALARQLDIPCLDLFPLFEAAGPDSLYFSGRDEHWNDAGQALAARSMYAFLQAEGLLAGLGE